MTPTTANYLRTIDFGNMKLRFFSGPSWTMTYRSTDVSFINHDGDEQLMRDITDAVTAFQKRRKEAREQ